MDRHSTRSRIIRAIVGGLRNVAGFLIPEFYCNPRIPNRWCYRATAGLFTSIKCDNANTTDSPFVANGRHEGQGTGNVAPGFHDELCRGPLQPSCRASHLIDGM